MNAVPPAEGDFLANLRHELRTPMNHILGYCQILLEQAAETGPARYVQDLQRIYLAAEHLLSLLNDLLHPSQVAAAQRAAEAEAFWSHARHELRTPLNQIIGYAEMLQEEAESDGAKAMATDLEKIHIAARRLNDMVQTLLQPENIQAGEMHIPESKPRFTPERLQASIAGLAGTLSEPAPAHGRLLIVDDNLNNRELLARRLERQGLSVEMAEDGQAALERLEQLPFDLVLLDVMMPVLDGFQTLERMKADPRWQNIPVIMISALDEMESIVRCIQMGAEDYLPKPFDPVLLRARVGASLEKKRLRDQEQAFLRQIAAEKQRVDELLHVILPHEVVQELKETGGVKPRRHETVGVMFCDIVGFTTYCGRREPEEVTAYLQELVETFEVLAAQHGLEKIKTIGDAFMTTSGLLKPADNPVLDCVRCGLEMVDAAPRLSAGWQVRVGIHCGPVMAGVVGHRQYLYDIWGDTVNTAARVEGLGLPDAVNLSGAAWEQVADFCHGVSRGMVQVKGKGQVEMFHVTGLKDD